MNPAKCRAGAPSTAGNGAGRGSFYFSQLAIPISTHKQKKKSLGCDFRPRGAPFAGCVTSGCSFPFSEPQGPQLGDGCARDKDGTCRVRVRMQREGGCDAALASSLPRSLSPCKAFLQGKQPPGTPLSLSLSRPLLSLSVCPSPACLTRHHRFLLFCAAFLGSLCMSLSLCPSLSLSFPLPCVSPVSGPCVSVSLPCVSLCLWPPCLWLRVPLPRSHARTQAIKGSRGGGWRRARPGPGAAPARPAACAPSRAGGPARRRPGAYQRGAAPLTKYGAARASGRGRAGRDLPPGRGAPGSLQPEG